jgi:hypothetical protein
MAIVRRTEPVAAERGAPVVQERVVEKRRGFFGALFATTVGVLAFIGLLVVAAVVLLFVIF